MFHVSLYFAVSDMTNCLSNKWTGNLHSCCTGDAEGLECNVKDVEDPLAGLVWISQWFTESPWVSEATPHIMSSDAPQSAEDSVRDFNQISSQNSSDQVTNRPISPIMQCHTSSQPHCLRTSLENSY